VPVRSANPTKVAFDLIAGSVPEHRRRLETFWEKYAVCFEEVDGKAGIFLNANIDRVQYTRKDLQVMWLTGFSLWRSLELFAPAVILPTLTGTPSSSFLTLDDKLEEFEYHYRERIGAVTALIGAAELDPARWPPDIPLMVDSRAKLTKAQDMVVFDLVMMATAVLFLHELKHVEFHAEHATGTPRPEKLAEEELQCDVWARDWFMSGLADYASKNGHSYQEVCSKRALALLLVCEYLRLADQHSAVFIRNDYPPLAIRIAALFDAVDLPVGDHCWVVAACILFAETRRQGKITPEFDNTCSKQITQRLIVVLTP